jgi:hypothetical protein
MFSHSKDRTVGQVEINKSKIKAECPSCNMMFQAKIGIKPQMREFPNK